MNHSPKLIPLIVRFPEDLYAVLKAEAQRTCAPMAVLVRRLVAEANFSSQGQEQGSEPCSK